MASSDVGETLEPSIGEEVVIKCDPFEAGEEGGEIETSVADNKTFHFPFSLNVAETNLGQDCESYKGLMASFTTEAPPAGYETSQGKIYVKEDQSTWGVDQTNKLYNVQINPQRTSGDINQAMVKPTQVSYECYYCCVNFIQRSELEQHVKIHAGQGEKPYKCPICKTRFSHKRNLLDHEKRHRSGSVHKCGICGKLFLSLAPFEKHQNIHRLEMPYRCDVCDSRFYFRSELENHTINIHKKVIPESQSAVQEQSSKIDLHVKRVIDNSGSENNVSSAKKIQKSDTPNTCSICGKLFSSTFLFQKHMKSHYLEMPYRCKICEARFYYKHEFENHSSVHS